MAVALSARDRVFVLKARRTAEYALFFLLHVGNICQEVEDVGQRSRRRRRIVGDACTYVTFALEQVASLVYSVHVSRDYLPANVEAAQTVREEPLPPAPAPIAFWRDEIWERTNRMRPERDSLWRVCAVEGGGGEQMSPDPRADEPALEAVLACAAGLTAALEAFLDATQASDPEGRALAILAAARQAIGRRFTFCLGVTVSLGLVLGVEAVRSLILNQGARALLPIGLSALPLLLFLPWSERRLKIDWGRRAFFSRHTAEPDPVIVRWPPRNPFTYRMPCETAFSLALFIGSFAVIGLGLALFALHVPKWTSFLTVYLSLALVLVFLRLCTFLDRWDFLDERPIRLRALSVGAVVVALILAEWFWALGLFLLGIGVAIVLRMWQRRAPRLLMGAASALTVLVTASSLQAALSRSTNAWSDKDTSEPGDPELRHVSVTKWPFDNSGDPVVVLAASGGGSRAAIYTAKTLMHLTTDLPEVADRLQAISSVSGGSLATAAYIARRYAGLPVTDLEAAVSNDFLLPTLVGAFAPWSTRGTAIEDSWRKSGPNLPGMGDLRMSHLALAWARAKDRHLALPPFPLPLFNTCALDGHDVVVTPLDRTLYTDASDQRWRRLRSEYDLQPAAVPTWVVDRDAIYGLEDLLPNANVLLASAVRASANFPFGFPLVDVETCDESLFLSPVRGISTAEAVRRTAVAVQAGKARGCHGPATVHLTDGGVLSNSGMWSLFQLLSRPQSMESLKKRGVLVILVEASKMPEYSESPRSLLTLFGTLGDRKPVAQSLHRRMFELLHQRYGGRLAVVQLDLIPEASPESFNVYTTWALDPKSQDRLGRSFELVWKKARGEIVRRFNILQAGGSMGGDDLVRPPLD